MDEYWQYNKTAAECHGYMFENSIATDIEFKLEHPKDYESKDGKMSSTFHAHKYMLISRSPVFWAMLRWQEKTSIPATILIDDVDPEAFCQTLRFIYTDKIDLNPRTVMHVWYIAKKYLLSTLDAACLNFLENQLSPSNAVLIYDQSLFYDEKELAKKCLKVITLKTAECLKSDSFLDIHRNTLFSILDLDQVTCSEVDIYKAVVAWASKQCQKEGLKETPHNIQTQLGNILSMIRFPTMDLSEFLNDVIPTNILSLNECSSITRFLESGVDGLSLAYNSIGRCYKLGAKIELTCSAINEEGHVQYIPGPEASYDLQLQTDCTISIHEILMYDASGKYENLKPASNACLEVTLTLNGAEIFSNHNNKTDTRYADNIKSIPLYGMRLNRGEHNLSVKHIWKGKCYHCRHFARCGSTLGAQFCYNCGNYSGLRPNQMIISNARFLSLDSNFVSITLGNRLNNGMPIVGFIFSDPRPD